MEHQNWDTFIINCKNKSSSNKSNNDTKKKPHKNVSKAVKLEKKVEEDNLTHKKIPKEIADAIRNARCQKKLKQKDLATQLNINVSILNDIETGKAIYNGLLISKIKRKLNIK